LFQQDTFRWAVEYVRKTQGNEERSAAEFSAENKQKQGRKRKIFFCTELLLLLFGFFLLLHICFEQHSSTRKKQRPGYRTHACVGVSTWSGFPVFGQNREPEPGYPGSLFWATGTGTGTPVKPESRLPAGSGCTRSGNRFFNKIIFGLIFGIGPKIYKLYV
jgi:hypothetical protein